MAAFARKAFRLVGGRLIVAAIAAALACTVAEHLAESPNTLAQRIIHTAGIVETPSTIGSADSDLYNRSQADVDATLDALQAMGVQNVRIIIPWAGVQPFNAPLYNWANVDRMVNAAAERGMGVLAVLNSTPRWAGRPYLSGHPDPEVFARFAGLVADRYEGKVSAYEVWNEPNALIFWAPVDPEAYTRLLQAGYTAIKQEDPSAVVVGGVVASVFSAGRATINPQDFVERMYAAGAKGYFDAISFHPYHYTLKFSEGTNNPLSALTQVEAIRQIMILNGDEELKIWATEYGLPTTETSTGLVITEEHQAEFIEDFLRSWQTVDGAGPMFIYSTRDTLSGDPNEQYNFGFFYSDWTPKLAAYVIAQFAGGQPPVGSPDPPDNPILDAAVAFARAIVDATVRVINAGVQLFVAAVDVTVAVIRGLVDLGVRVVRGLANATVAVISGVVDAIGGVIDGITDRFEPEPDGTAGVMAAQRAAEPTSSAASEPSTDTLATADDVAEADATGEQPSSRAENGRTESITTEDETTGTTGSEDDDVTETEDDPTKQAGTSDRADDSEEAQADEIDTTPTTPTGTTEDATPADASVPSNDEESADKKGTDAAGDDDADKQRDQDAAA